ncbi:hypothetical protein D3C81_1834080 [compost metagenome]
MHLEPALTQRTQHAHRLNGFGIVQMAGGQLAGLLRITGRFAQRLFGHVFVETGQADQQQCACCGEHTEPDVEQVNHKQVDREPWRIEKREQRRPGNELTNVRQIAQ